MYKVMLVDDEPIIVEGLSRSIPWEKWNCGVVATANDGLEGKERIEQYKPNILFMDICMPEMDGLTLIAAIKSEYPDTEVCILTGFRDFEYAQKAICLGVTRFLLKPSNMDELEEAISAMCENLKKKSITGEESVATGEAAEKAEAKEEDGTSEVTAGDGTGAQEDAAAQPHESASSSFIVKNALKYIEANYNQKLTLCEVAEKTYVSQWHLSKLLNRHTGQSFSDILNHCRIEHAKKLLEDPSLRIGDISDAVGFLDLAHFSRVFKKQEGMSANEWRNQKLGS